MFRCEKQVQVEDVASERRGAGTGEDAGLVNCETAAENIQCGLFEEGHFCLFNSVKAIKANQKTIMPVEGFTPKVATIALSKARNKLIMWVQIIQRVATDYTLSHRVLVLVRLLARHYLLASRTEFHTEAEVSVT